MNLIDLTPGLYQLRQPLLNVHGDRRKKYGWTELAHYPAGLYLVEDSPFEEHPQLVHRFILRINERNNRELGFDFVINTAKASVITPNESRTAQAVELANFLERDDSLAAFLRLHDSSTVTDCYHLVLQLVKDGAISEDTVRKTLAAMGDGE